MEQEVKCEFCNDTGYVTNVEYNSDTHRFEEAGLIECKHPDNHEDYSTANGGD